MEGVKDLTRIYATEKDGNREVNLGKGPDESADPSEEEVRIQHALANEDPAHVARPPGAHGRARQLVLHRLHLLQHLVILNVHERGVGEEIVVFVAGLVFRDAPEKGIISVLVRPLYDPPTYPLITSSSLFNFATFFGFPFP